jgi:hypothetical protein
LGNWNHTKTRMNSYTPECLAVPAPLMAPIKHDSNKLHMKMYTPKHKYILQRYTKRKVWRYQRGNEKPEIEGQTTQWQKEKGQTMICETLHRKLKIEQYEHK